MKKLFKYFFAIQIQLTRLTKNLGFLLQLFSGINFKHFPFSRFLKGILFLLLISSWLYAFIQSFLTYFHQLALMHVLTTFYNRVNSVEWRYLVLSKHLKAKKWGERNSLFTRVLNPIEIGDRKLEFDWLNFINKDSKFWVPFGSKIIPSYDWPINPKNLCPWLVELSQSNVNLW